MAVRYCKSCGHEFELRARFCSNCGNPRPTSPLTKANAAPTYTPQEILAWETGEGAEQEQAAEVPRVDSPEPVHKAAHVPPPQPDDGFPQPASEPITPPSQKPTGENGPDARETTTNLGDGARLTTALLIGLPFAAVSLVAGLGGSTSIAVYFAVVVLVRLVQRDRRQREELRSVPVHAAPIPTPPQEREGGEASATVPTPEADVPVPPATPEQDETAARNPPYIAGNAKEPSDSASLDLGPTGSIVRSLVIVLVGFILLAGVGAVFGGAGIAGLLVIGGLIALLRYGNLGRSLRTPRAQEYFAKLENVGFMSGGQFEVFVAEVLRAQGYGATVLGGSGDQGVDIIANPAATRGKIAIQCKNYRKPVGNKPVQEVYAGAKHHRCDDAWVVAPSGYTKGASELARSVGVRLLGAEDIKEWISQVDKAERAKQGADGVRDHAHGQPKFVPPKTAFAPHSKQGKKDRKNYWLLLDQYEQYLELLEKTQAIRQRHPENSKVEQETINTRDHIYDNLEKPKGVLEKLDTLEARNVGMSHEENRRAHLRTRQAEIERLLGRPAKLR